jgi:hypothetical protein
MRQFFTEDNNRLSMKRLCGFICVISLCISMYYDAFSSKESFISDSLVYSLASISAACLGLTSVEKIFKKKFNGTKQAQ